MRTGILGGTFDPIHIAHLHAGEVALHQASLDRIVYIPAGKPWQKANKGVSAGEHRLEMTRLAISGCEGFEVDDREVLRDGPTYTADTLATFPDEEELFLILGADAALGLPTWERTEEVLERVTVLVVPRPGSDGTEVRRRVPECVFLDMASFDVSGTDVRAMARGGRPFRFLVVEPVYDYIMENQLYAQRDGADNVRTPNRMERSS